MKKIIQLVVLTLTLAGAAFAQFEPAEPIKDMISVSGNETSGGRFMSQINQVMGNSFVLNGYSREYSSMLLTISVDYDGPADYASGNTIVSGSWNLAIYSDGNYLGSIYGEVTNGFIKWSGVVAARNRSLEGTAEAKNTTANLKVIGGTGDFERYVSQGDVVYDGDTELSTGDTKSILRGIEF